MKINNKMIFSMCLIITLLFLNINKAYAVEKVQAYCYYANDDKSFRVIVRYYTGEGGNGREINSIHGEVRVMNFEGKSVNKIGKVQNINEKWRKFSKYEMSAEDIEAMKRNYDNCPKYLATANWQKNSIITDDQSIAQTANQKLQSVTLYGERTSSEDFFGINLCGDNDSKNNQKIDCNLGEVYDLHCDSGLFGDPNDEESLGHLILWALKIIRIIAIALLIVLGTIDMGKAVLAAKEDEMKKAQKTFIKRIIACICVFLVPTFVNIIMNLTNTAFEGKDYEICTLKDIRTGQTYSVNNGSGSGKR